MGRACFIGGFDRWTTRVVRSRLRDTRNVGKPQGRWVEIITGKDCIRTSQNRELAKAFRMTFVQEWTYYSKCIIQVWNF